MGALHPLDRETESNRIESDLILHFETYGNCLIRPVSGPNQHPPARLGFYLESSRRVIVSCSLAIPVPLGAQMFPTFSSNDFNSSFLSS